MLDCFGALHSLYEPRSFDCLVSPENNKYLASDHLFSQISKSPLCAVIPSKNEPGWRQTDDRIIGRVDDCAHAGTVFFNSLAFSNVPCDRRYSNHLALAILYWCMAEIEMNLVSVL